LHLVAKVAVALIGPRRVAFVLILLALRGSLALKKARDLREKQLKTLQGFWDQLAKLLVLKNA
jgi:hypothetical protein